MSAGPSIGLGGPNQRVPVPETPRVGINDEESDVGAGFARDGRDDPDARITTNDRGLLGREQRVAELVARRTVDCAPPAELEDRGQRLAVEDGKFGHAPTVPGIDASSAS